MFVPVCVCVCEDRQVLEKGEMTDTNNSSEKNASNDMDLVSLPPSKTSEFTKELFLGKGSYGSVWLIRRHDNNKQYALKEVDLKNKQDSEKYISI